MQRRFLIFVAVGAVGLASCAKPSAPRGGEPDREPPHVRATTPEPLAVVPGWDEPVVIRFDERISEKGIRDAVLVSPETGEVRVKKGRSSLEVSLEGGWRPNQVYRVVVLPVIQDLFGNRIKEEIELVFSTGPEVPATALAGVVTDRLTGKPEVGARVEAIRAADSTVYATMTDSTGAFAFRHIPTGAYEIRSYRDRNRNRRGEFFEEPVDTARAELASADTVILSFALLARDTTPARLVRAEARDSMQVRLHLDDYMDADIRLDSVRTRLWLLPDSAEVPVERVFLPHEFEAWLAARTRAAADSAAADTVAGAGGPDSAGVPVSGDSARRTRPDTVPGPEDPSTAEATGPLPSRELVLVPASPLRPGASYRVEVTGVENIVGLGGGGGSVTFRAPAPAPRDTTKAATPPDTAKPALSPDTTRSERPKPPAAPGAAPPPSSTGSGGP